MKSEIAGGWRRLFVCVVGERDGSMRNPFGGAVGAVLMLCCALALLPAAAQAQSELGGSGAGAGQLSNPSDVAIHQASGRVFVADQANERVSVFAADGTFLRAFGWGVDDGSSALQTCTTTCQSGLAGDGGGQFSGPGAIAVDQDSGDVYVADGGNYRVQKFDADGNFLLTFGVGVDKTSDANVCTAASGHTCGAGIAGTGDGQFFSYFLPGLIDVDASGTVYVGDANRVEKFTSEGTFIGQIAIPLNAGSGGDHTTPGVVVDHTGNFYTFTDLSTYWLRKWSPSGGLLRAWPQDYSPQALAVDNYANLYVREMDDADRVTVYDPAGNQVNRVSLGTDPGSRGAIAFADADRTIYAVDRANDRVVVVSTAPPPGPFVSPGSDRVKDVGYTDATLNAIINPEGAPTTYHFEYGRSSAYGQNTPTGPLAADFAFHPVSVPLAGLEAGTTYHFRLVVGGVAGPDRTFTTFRRRPPSACPNAGLRYGDGADLPDCRAYEQVSPADKNHSDVVPNVLLNSLDGNAAAFGSFNAFPDAPSSPLLVQFAATRDATAWLTRTHTPPFSTLYQSDTGQTYELGASADYKKALVLSTYALTPGSANGNGNLYIHDTTDDSYRLLASQSLGFGPGTASFLFNFAGAGTTGEHWVFSTYSFIWNELASTPAAPVGAAQNLFDWSPSGGLQLVGILPDGSVAPEGAVQAGSSVTSVGSHAVSADGRRIYWTEGGFSGPYPVYLREGDETKPVSRDASGVDRPARFWSATPDGSSALLTSDSPLTANASPAGSDLYRYDAATGKLTDLTPDAGGAGVVGVFGAGDDASHVYFLATGALAPGATAGEQNIFVWHDGEIRYVGALASGATGITQRFDDGLGSRWRVSPDGRSFGFLFSGAIDGPQAQPAQTYDQAYFYSDDDRSLVCASCRLNGGASSGPATFVTADLSGPTLGRMASAQLAVTDHGRMFFNSPDPLVPGDANVYGDVYEYERDGAGSCDGTAENGGCLSLISSGHGDGPSVLGGASGDGDAAFFLSYDRLVGQDQDNGADVYVARVDGGLAGQRGPGTTAPCVGDACKGAAVAPPPEPLTSPGSASFSGAQVAPAPRVKPAKIQVSKVKTVRGTSTTIKVKVPGKGRIEVSGSGLRGASKTAAKAGSYGLTVRLSPQAQQTLKRKHQVKVRVTVRFAPAKGSSQQAQVTATFTPAAKKRSSSSSRATRRATVPSSDVRKGR